MRVLLPLRKIAASNQSSSESLEEFEQEEQQASEITQGHTEENYDRLSTKVQQSEEFLPPAGQISSGFTPDIERKLSSLPSTGALKTTGLHSEVTNTSRKRPTIVPRKRRRTTLSAAIEDNLERLASDKKPAAKPSDRMGLGPPNRKMPPLSRVPDRGMGNPPLVMSRSSESSDDDPHLLSSRKMPAASDALFCLELKHRGLEIREQEGDGNCLFRAVSLQVYGDSSMHGQVRKQCMDFMERDTEHFSQFVPGENFSMYIRRKRQDGVHGNNPEIQAISELFNRPIEVFSPENGSTPLNIFHAEYKTDDAPIRLSYHDGNHYNAVIDPLVPTAGLGLGLPGLQPGLADKLQLAKAVAESDATADEMELARALKESDDDELQRALKESQLSTEHSRSNAAMAQSDVDATYFELEQAALERSLQTHIQHEYSKKKRASSPSQEGHAGSLPDQTLTKMQGSTALSDSVPVPAVASLLSHVPPMAAAAAFVSSGPSVASVASAAASEEDEDNPTPIRSVDEYSPVVQEMVVNGFELAKVVRAVELIGENFDDLLAFLMSSCAK